MLDVCLLGTGGMMPLPYRWLTSMMARYNGKSRDIQLFCLFHHKLALTLYNQTITITYHIMVHSESINMKSVKANALVKRIFPRTIAAKDGQTIELDFEEQ